MSPDASRCSLVGLLAVLIPLTGCSVFGGWARGPAPARMAEDGRALMPIVIGAGAAHRLRAAAATLADYLGRMSGAEFALRPGDGSAGIVVGAATDFDRLPFQVDLPGGPFEREAYVLRSSAHGLWLIGATELAVEHAVWDTLYRLGYRQFFPGQTWEVVPHSEELALSVDTQESPDFCARRIWYNWGLWGYNNEPYADWCARNRVVRGFLLHSGHAYGSIAGASRAAFEAHPEYYALVNGERQTGGDAKFCVSNPGLRKLVVDWAVEQCKQHPEMDSMSMEPSDGGGWCECEACQEMGSPSDRALTLANEVADAINKLGLGEKYVGMYAYNLHSPPPSIRVHPNVIISTTTAFLRGGYSLDQIIEGWQEKGATLGIYDYFSVVAWDWNLPRRAKTARPHGVAESIRNFHEKGARFYDCESGDAWGPYGLGYYVAGRVMWDVQEADRVDELVDDFLSKAFGPAREPMEKFYHLITVDDRRRSDADVVGRMYRCLAEARRLAAERSDVMRRLDDLVLYTRYVDLFSAYADASGEAKNAAKEDVLRHCYRMRRTMMVHSYGLWARLIGQGAAHDPDQPLKSEAPFGEEELTQILERGIAENEPVEMGFEAVRFGKNLVPAAARLGLPDVTPGSFPTVPQDSQNYYIWVQNAPAQVHLKVTVQKVWDLRPHKISLYRADTDELVAESGVVRPDGTQYDVVLDTPHAGLHRVLTQDGGDYTRIVWPEGVPVTIPTGEDTAGVTNHFRGPWSLYFYVPRGTVVVGGWASRIANWAPPVSGKLLDGDGGVVHEFAEAGDSWFSVPVPEGQDGRLWKFESTQGQRLLMTVPPYVARTGEELLLPAEVVEADSK